MVIAKISFNWRQIQDEYGAYAKWDEFIVGEYGVRKIEGYLPEAHPSAWHYRVTFEDDSVQLIFNINQVFYEPEPNY